MTAAKGDVATHREWKTEWGDGYIKISKRGSTSANTTADNFIRHGRIRPGSRVLDMGCGHGRITELLVTHVPNLDVAAVDLTRELLERFLVKSGTNGCRLQKAQTNFDLQALPFSDNEFDAVVSARVFHYLKDPANAVREAYRVVKPGGIVVVSIPNRLNPLKYLSYKRAKLYTPFDAASWFRDCGFENVRYGSMCFFPSTHGWHRVAPLVENCARVPGLRLFGGNLLVSGQKE